MQVRFTEEKLTEDLQRKTKTVAESLELSARYVLLNNDSKAAQALVEKFQERERLQGCVIYDKEGNVLLLPTGSLIGRIRKSPILRKF